MLRNNMIFKPIYLKLFYYYAFQRRYGASHDRKNNLEGLKLSKLVHYGCLKMNVLTPDDKFRIASGLKTNFHL